jgi:phage gp46-like protein
MTMSDLALRWDGDALAADLAVEANDFARDATLQTAVELSLFLDRRADDGDQLPDQETDRRGWWGDSVPVVPGDRIGSRLWLLAREKQTATTRARLEQFAREALAWLLEDKVAAKVEVVASFPRPVMWGLEVAITRPSGDPVRFQFGGAWTELAAAAGPLDVLPGDPVVTSSDAPIVTSTGGYLTAP